LALFLGEGEGVETALNQAKNKVKKLQQNLEVIYWLVYCATQIVSTQTPGAICVWLTCENVQDTRASLGSAKMLIVSRT
jgi:hypothetical protein